MSYSPRGLKELNATKHTYMQRHVGVWGWEVGGRRGE